MPNLFTPPHAYVPSATGLPQAGALAYFFITATATPKNTYSDFALSVPNANPVVADANGVWPAIYMATDINYRVTLKTALGVTLYTQDDVPGPLMSLSDIGAILYPRTAQEITAGITPTDLRYPFSVGGTDVRRYGVKFDSDVSGASGTDDTAAWNAIGAAAWASNITLTTPPAFSKITNTVTLPSPWIALMMDPGARIVYVGAYDRTALVLGADAKTFTNRDFNVSVATPVGNTWANQSCVGVQMRGSWSANRVRLNWVNQFTIGWQLWGTSANGIAYNTFDLGTCFDAAYALDIHSAVANGFINENLFLNGQFQIASTPVSGMLNTVPRYGVIFRAEAGAYTGANKNHFVKPCFQLGQTGISVDAVPIVFSNAGGNNEFHNVRAELINGEIVRIISDTISVQLNTVDLAYVGTTVGAITAHMTETDGGLSFGNRITLNGIPNAQYYRFDDVVSKAWSPSAGQVSVLGMFAHANAANEQTSIASRIGKDYLIITANSAFGVYVDTTYFKNFEVKTDSIPGFCGRLSATAWDANDVQISSTRAVNFQAVGQSAQYGTALYGQQADLRGVLNFRVDSTVKKIKLMFTAGTNQQYLRGFSIHAFGSLLTDTPQLAGINSGLNVWGGPFAPVARLSASIPSGATVGNGYTPRGLMIGNTAAAVAATQGWICTLGGWNARAWVLTTAYLVNDMVTNGGNTYVCAIAGTSAGAGGPAGTTNGIVDNTVTWNYIGNYVGIPVVTQATWQAMPNL